MSSSLLIRHAGSWEKPVGEVRWNLDSVLSNPCRSLSQRPLRHSQVQVRCCMHCLNPVGHPAWKQYARQIAYLESRSRARPAAPRWPRCGCFPAATLQHRGQLWYQPPVATTARRNTGTRLDMLQHTNKPLLGSCGELAKEKGSQHTSQSYSLQKQHVDPWSGSV